MKKIIVICLAVIMVMTMPVMALAETHNNHDGSTVDHGSTSFAYIEAEGSNTVCKTTGAVGSSQTSTLVDPAINAKNGATVEAGSATNETDFIVKSTVNAQGNNTSVTVSGAVTNEGSGGAIYAWNGATVKAGSATNDGALPTVKGNFIDPLDPSVIHTYDNQTTITVGTVVNKGIGRAIYAENGATVTAGSATNGKAGNESLSTVCADNANVVINGNVTNKGKDSYAIGVNEKGTIKVDGDVTAGNGIKLKGTVASTGDIVVAINGELTSNRVIDIEEGTDTNKCDIYIYGITTTGDIPMDINYILHGNDEKADYANMTITDSDGSALETIDINSGTYKVSKAGNISVTVDDGYEFSTGATIVSVDGNKYLITVPLGGHVTLKAIKKAIQQIKSSGSTGTFTEYPSELGSEDNPITGGEWKEEDGKWYYIYQGSKLIHTVAWIKYTDKDGKEILGCYYFDKSGVMVTDKEVAVRKRELYYFGLNGSLEKKRNDEYTKASETTKQAESEQTKQVEAKSESDSESYSLYVSDQVSKIGEAAFGSQKSNMTVITLPTDSSEYATLPVYANIEESLNSEKAVKLDDSAYRTESADEIIEIGPAFDPKLQKKTENNLLKNYYGPAYDTDSDEWIPRNTYLTGDDNLYTNYKKYTDGT